MRIKIWPFFIVEITTYAVRYQIADKYHEICNRFALRTGRPFKDQHLEWAATSRCDCGAGLAYPKGLQFKKDLKSKYNSWDCSDILTGRALTKDQPGAKTHTGGYPFTFYDIKSDNQPSAYGASTRPKKK